VKQGVNRHGSGIAAPALLLPRRENRLEIRR
jgi:hypothetical protein